GRGLGLGLTRAGFPARIGSMAGNRSLRARPGAPSRSVRPDDPVALAEEALLLLSVRGPLRPTALAAALGLGEGAALELVE
ncbi:MAG: hypothetical protein ACKPBU_15580, partial [Alphaproteobacteria bacterium]